MTKSRNDFDADADKFDERDDNDDADDGGTEKLPAVSVIIPAAGDSSRLAADKRKPWLPLGGELLAVRTLRLLKSLPMTKEIILAVHPDDEHFAKETLGEKLRQAGATLIIVGGKTRSETVYRALQITDPHNDVVAVHDVARPFADREMCAALFKMANRFGAAIPVAPINDSIKRIDGDRISENIRRRGLMAAQTPQCFRREVLIESYAFAENTGGIGEAITDDAGLVENYGQEIRVLLGSSLNFKLTTKDDWRIAEIFLNAGLVK